MTKVAEYIAQQMQASVSVANTAIKAAITPVFNVKGYGATGLGVADDSSFINNAITALNAAGGGTIYFPKGTYKISSNLTFPATATLKFDNGAILSPDTGITVTINGPIIAGLTKIFGGAGTIAGNPQTPSVYPQWWGAKCDGVTDDTTALQATINYCLSKTLPLVNGQSLIPILEIPGICFITSSLMVDRPINQTNFFRIRGQGIVGGFLTTSAIKIFSTTYAGSNQSIPSLSVLSNQISFENLTFSSTIAGATAIDLKKYVRTRITGCFFQGIQLDVSVANDYIQSAYISQCFARGITGKFLAALDMYDVRVKDCLFEVVSDTIFYASGKVYGGAFNNNMAENCGGSYVNFAYAYGVEVNGCYAESNSGRFLKIDYAYGVEASGNYVYTRGVGAGGPDNQSDVTFYEIYLGECYGFKGSSNSFVHKGYQFEGVNKIATVGQGDYAGVTLIRDFSLLTRSTYGDITSNGGLTILGLNATGVGKTLSVKNSGAGYNTQNLIDFIHQTQSKVRMRTSLNVDANASGNWSLETMDNLGAYAERLRLNYYQMLLAEGINIEAGTVTGSKIGGAATQKLAFWGKVPVVQPVAIANATDAASVITQLNSLLATLRTLGIIAT